MRPTGGERGLSGAGAPERVGGFQRGGNELVERDKLGSTETNIALLARRAEPPRAGMQTPGGFSTA
jgi:hypothetical protein